ncbi:hypothetical protein GON01_09125 [Sphingomonas sp. MAH-20]|uniref:Phage shock protein B n=2 Tax=Sphingomonadaceae TaxID=41297 RepID=A0A6I4J1C9_9SPHN|nr:MULTISPECIES: hypothetical protein [Sphingomonas]MBA2919857.1 hypothetical protein [Sphingomonas sp. CGMCC 1.13658]MVO78096.1 hypothetical protein [Sphingomonas horti]
MQNAFPYLALSIPILGILAGMFARLMRLREKQLEIQAGQTAEKAAQYAAHTERLEQRVRVLERIITDRGVDVAGEIDRLRDQPLN